MKLPSVRRLSSSLPALTMAAAVAISLCVFGFVGWKSWQARAADLAQSAKDGQNLSRSLAEHASRTLEGIDLILTGIEERLGNEHAGPAQVDRMQNFLARRVQQLPQIRELGVFDASGAWQFASVSPLPAYTNDDRPWFKHHRDHDDHILLVTGPLKTRLANRWSLLLTRRVNDRNGAFAGVVLASVDLDYFRKFHEGFDIGREGGIAVFHDDGRLLMRHPFSEENLGRDFSRHAFFLDHFSTATTGYYQSRSVFDGVVKRTAFERVAKFPIIVSVTLSENEILAAWRNDLTHDLLFAGMVAMMLMGMAAFVALQLRSRLRAELEARTARRQAEQAAATQGQFLTTMSHELRTPLNSVLGFADILLDRTDLNPEVRRQVGLIQTAGAFLLTAVNDVLDFSKIEEGRLELSNARFSLRALVDNSVSVVRDLADKKKLGLQVWMDPRLPAFAVGDEARLRQVLLNLLNNAIKFTVQGRIALTVEHRGTTRDGEAVRVSVADTGIGIAPDRTDRLFRRFSQVDGSTSREFGGSGLGLAICKRLVELMGGEIGVQTTPGIGSTFWFIVALPAAEAPTRGELGNAMVASDTRPLRILVVEDVDVNQEIARSFLESAGHSVDVADDGTGAIAAVQAKPYDVVLMDIQMPVMDGITATRAIRALSGDVARIPILAMTANVLPQQVESFRMAGMNGHVAKPLRRADLLAKVAHCRQPGGEAGASADTTHGSHPVLDQATFDEIFALLGHAKATDLLAKLRAQLGVSFASDAKREAVAREAHKLISMAGTFGFVALSESCAALEDAATEDHDIVTLLDTVRKECGAALAAIAAHMEPSAASQKSA